MSPSHGRIVQDRKTPVNAVAWILESKQKLFDQLIDDVSLDLIARMNSEELFGLFGLEPAPERKR